MVELHFLVCCFVVRATTFSCSPDCISVVAVPFILIPEMNLSALRLTKSRVAGSEGSTDLRTVESSLRDESVRRVLTLVCLDQKTESQSITVHISYRKETTAATSVAPKPFVLKIEFKLPTSSYHDVFRVE